MCFDPRCFPPSVFPRDPLEGEEPWLASCGHHVRRRGQTLALQVLVTARHGWLAVGHGLQEALLSKAGAQVGAGDVVQEVAQWWNVRAGAVPQGEEVLHHMVQGCGARQHLLLSAELHVFACRTSQKEHFCHSWNHFKTRNWDATLSFKAKTNKHENWVITVLSFKVMSFLSECLKEVATVLSFKVKSSLRECLKGNSIILQGEEFPQNV